MCVWLIWGIQSAGQEVTISYGPWPSQPFFLLFGFVPGANPYESVSLFTDLDHMASQYLHYLEETGGERGAEQYVVSGQV